MKMFADILKKAKLMPYNLSIAWRLILCIALGAAIVIGLMMGGSYHFIEDALAKNLAGYMQSLAVDIAEEIGTYLKEIEHTNNVLAAKIETDIGAKKDIELLLKEQLVSSDTVFGVCVAYEPVIVNGEKTIPDSLYVSYLSDKVDVLYESPYSVSFYRQNQNYLYDREWYSAVRQSKRPMWIGPYNYTDNDGNTTRLITYSSPLFKDSDPQKFIGVVGTDISLDWFLGGLGSWILKKISYAFILSPNGTFLVSTSEELSRYKTIYDFAEAYQHELLSQMVQNISDSKSGFVEIKKLIKNEAAWFIYLPIADTGLTLGIFFPKYRLIELAKILLRLQLILGGSGFILLIIVISLLIRTITEPLRELNLSVKNISKDIDAKLPDFPGNDEVAALAKSYRAMIGELKVNMELLRETTISKEKIESELRIARSIQMGLVPKQFPAFPERDEFDIYAVLNPAKEVGGDFYDFFFLDNDHLCLVIGDVSGKGVPAAIFMAVVRTLVQAFAKNNLSPGALLQQVNDELAKNNENCMFVTLFCAVIHLPSGKCRFANGGHNLPLLIERGESGEVKVSRLPKIKGCLVGVVKFEEQFFAEEVFWFKPGSSLFLYTDGVSESENYEGGFYGENRLIETLSGVKESNCRNLIEQVRQNLAVFAAGHEQSDDITIIAFDYLRIDQ